MDWGKRRRSLGKRGIWEEEAVEEEEEEEQSQFNGNLGLEFA